MAEAGLETPADWIKYGDFHLNPPLTTVSLPAAGLGSGSAKLLICLILGKKQVNPKQVILPSHLLIRKTCREIK